MIFLILSLIKSQKPENILFEIKSAPIRKDSLLKYDLVILLTDHDEYDYAMIEKNAKMIIDTRESLVMKMKKYGKHNAIY